MEENEYNESYNYYEDYDEDLSLNYTYYDDYLNYSDQLSSQTLPDKLLLWLEVSRGLWWFTVLVASISTVIYGLVVVYLALSRKECRQFALIMAITITDGLMLLGMGIGVFLQGYLGDDTAWGERICKFLMYTTNVASFYTNWCWVLLWGQRYIKVFHPFSSLTISKEHAVRYILPGLLVGVLMVESWTIVAATEFNAIGIHFCGLDTERWGMDTLKWIILAEVIISYFIPFFLVIIVNIRIVHKVFIANPTFSTITHDQIRISKQKDHQRLTRRIIHRSRREKSKRLRTKFLIRTALAALLDLGLNLPDYFIQLLDNFVPLNHIIPNFELKLTVETSAFVLYFLQYPLIIFYVHILIQDFKKSKEKTNTDTEKMESMEGLRSIKRSETLRLSEDQTDLKYKYQLTTTMLSSKSSSATKNNFSDLIYTQI